MQANIFDLSKDYFETSNWEADKKKMLIKKGIVFNRGNDYKNLIPDNNIDDQFILLQLSEQGQSGSLLSTTEVTPILMGDSEKKDINLQIAFDSVKIAADRDTIQKNSKATLQLVIGQENKLSGLDKLFFCINGGLSLFNDLKGRPTKCKEFEKNTLDAFGNRPISLPSGVGQITLKVVKHRESIWWQRIFEYLKSDSAKELISLTGFGGITERALDTIGNLLNNLFDKEPEVLFKSIPIKVAFSNYGKTELNGGLSTSIVSCLNPGYWIMVRASDYDKFISAKPIYYAGFGVLAPNGMKEKDAIIENGDNFLNKLSYVVIKAKIKEVNLSQNTF